MDKDKPFTPRSAFRGTDTWVEKLRKRLKGPRSRVRERRADFLMYQAVDLCTDDLVSVTQAFMSRLRYLEEVLQTDRAFVSRTWVGEVTRINLQLAVVSRRLRGLQRIMRKWKDDKDLSLGMTGYLQDVLDHVDEASDDTLQLTEKCDVLIAAHERFADQAQERASQRRSERTNLQDERMNLTLFVLTIATFIFAPMQFIAGVYGMNFVDNAGTPTIPELLYPRGYMVFWVCVSCYIVVASCLAVWGWRRMMGSVDDDLHRRFPHLACHDIPSSPTDHHFTRPRSAAAGGVMKPLDSVTEEASTYMAHLAASDGFVLHGIDSQKPQSRLPNTAARHGGSPLREALLEPRINSRSWRSPCRTPEVLPWHS